MIIRKLHKINKSSELKCWTHQGPVLPVDHRHSVQSLSHVRLFATQCTVVREGTLSITNYRSLLKLMSIESVMPSNYLFLCCPLLLPPSIFPSIRVFQWVSSSHQVAKVLEFQLQHQPSNEYSGLISFRMDWLDFLAVQGILKSLF